MNLILAVLLSGDCQVQRVVVKQQVAKVQQFAYAPVVTKQYATVQVPLYDPGWYVVGESQRLRKLEEIVERQQALAEQQAQAIELLRGASTAGGGASESPLAVEARKILQANCMSCHSGADIKGGVDLYGPLDLATKLLISEVVSTGAMPPSPKQPLDDQQASTIAAWATEDKKAVRDFLKAQRTPPAPQPEGQ